MGKNFQLGGVMAWVLAGSFVLAGCGSDKKNDNGSTGASGGSGGSGAASGAGGGGGVPDAAPEAAWPNLECDPLVPEYCGFPFPSNVFTADDSSTPTGRRVSVMGDFMPTSSQGPQARPDPFNVADGFSPGIQLLAYFEDAQEDGLVTPDNIGDSLENDSLTVIINAETGERVPHWAELDYSYPNDPMRSFQIRPAVRLDDSTRYIVAIRGLQNSSGAIEPSPAFKALRDNEPFSDDASVDQRRGLYADIFQRLGDAGVERDSLQLAWDFSTASRESTTSWMVHMRDESLTWLEENLEYSIDSVDETYKTDRIAYRIEGTFKSPLYVDDPAPGSNLLFGDDGMPEMNSEQPTIDVPFTLLIPQSALTTPAGIVEYGHGLLGSRGQVGSDNLVDFANEYNYAIFGIDLMGFASEDEQHITAILGSGQLDELKTMYDRIHQGTLNHLVAMRVMRDGMASDMTYGQYLDDSKLYYHGISQGGIFGPVYMALTTDVQRGVLGVPGQSYNLLLNRSVDFAPFFTVVRVTYPQSQDGQLFLSLIQGLWDRVEPTGYSPYVTQNPLPGSSEREVLMRAAVGDHQVTTLGAHIMARSMGATHVDTGVRDIYGLTKADSATGAGYVEYDFGLPKEPTCNKPMSLCDDPHGKIRGLDEAQQQMDQFFRTGEIQNYCPEGVCIRDDLSGCSGDEFPADQSICLK